MQEMRIQFRISYSHIMNLFNILMLLLRSIVFKVFS